MNSIGACSVDDGANSHLDTDLCGSLSGILDAVTMKIRQYVPPKSQNIPSLHDVTTPKRPPFDLNGHVNM